MNENVPALTFEWQTQQGLSMHSPLKLTFCELKRKELKGFYLSESSQQMTDIMSFGAYNLKRLFLISDLIVFYDFCISSTTALLKI